jgi:hypothetical protein
MARIVGWFTRRIRRYTHCLLSDRKSLKCRGASGAEACYRRLRLLNQIESCRRLKNCHSISDRFALVLVSVTLWDTHPPNPTNEAHNFVCYKSEPWFEADGFWWYWILCGMKYSIFSIRDPLTPNLRLMRPVPFFRIEPRDFECDLSQTVSSDIALLPDWGMSKR